MPPIMPVGISPLPFDPQLTVRVDVDRFYPQRRISVELSRRFPMQRAHVIAEVTSDLCVGFNNRVVHAEIVYRDGDTSAFPGDRITFRAKRTTGKGYGAYSITLHGAGTTKRTFTLHFRSRYFDAVNFEVDQVSNAGTVVTSYDTGSHDVRPADLPDETLSLATVYQRAGFDVRMSSGTSTIPVADAGANGTWSDSEMHNAMVTYWSLFADRPQWAMWVLYAARHDSGRSLGGIMFDDIGPNHRQGTAIFTDSFIQDAPAGDPQAAAWRRRMQFWTAVHEMGHGFNLAHSWQKSLGAPYGNPWVPLTDEPEARTFMNYPYNVSGGERAFFEDFRFRFSDQELLFMRHAPRRFVQMGNSAWFADHGFEAPDALAPWSLRIRPNKMSNSFRFLEPVHLELKLTNLTGRAAVVDADHLSDGRHISLLIQRDGGLVKPWRPLITRCHEHHGDDLKHGASVYGAHPVSATPEGWVIDEPGFYTIQAAVQVEGQVVISNALRIHVAPAASAEEARVAGDWFTEEVARALAFQGAPALKDGMRTLEEVAERLPDNPAALHAAVALSSPQLRQFKQLVTADGGALAVRSGKKNVEQAVKRQRAALLKSPERSADTFGHIRFFAQLNTLALAAAEDGNATEARKLLSTSIDLMKQRAVLDSVIRSTEKRLASVK
jgi:hypothetical protein